jgi:hypothetical protein
MPGDLIDVRYRHFLDSVQGPLLAIQSKRLKAIHRNLFADELCEIPIDENIASGSMDEKDTRACAAITNANQGFPVFRLLVIRLHKAGQLRDCGILEE